MNKRGTLWALLAALGLALVCELLVFNWRAVFSLGQGDWTPLPEPTVSGDLARDGELALFFYDLDREVSWCHLDLEVRDAEGLPVVTDFTLNLSDEGSQRLYRAGEIRYFPGHDKAAWFRLNSYGAVRHLSLVLKTETLGCGWTLKAAEINGRVPFRISLPRLGGLFLLPLLLWLLRPGSRLYDNRLWNRRAWSKPLCAALILALNLGLLLVLARSNSFLTQLPEEPKWFHHRQYALLAEALARGETHIDGPEQAPALALLAQLDNPYNSSARRALFQSAGLECPWDTAYFHGHLYVYFGVLPVLLAYLPWYLLTGRALPTLWAAFAFGALALIAAFLLVRALIRRWFPGTPFAVYLLLSLLLGNCGGVLCFALCPSFYVVPVLLALALVYFALALWIGAAEAWSPAAGGGRLLPPGERCFAPVSPGRGVGLRIALGALLAALTAASRPQFLVYSALALPILWSPLRREKDRGRALGRTLCFALPYAAVALPLMYYNALRFASPLDFGANYNLTTNDMPHRGFRLGRLPDGLFAYLLRLPNLELQFPYLRQAALTPLYLGKTISEPMYGGVLPLFPFLWVLAGLPRARRALKEKGLRLLTLLPPVLALAVVTADTQMAGILWRYTADFLGLLLFSGALVFLTLLEGASHRGRRRLLGFLPAALLLGLLVCFLVSISLSELSARCPELYYRLKDLLSVA